MNSLHRLTHLTVPTGHNLSRAFRQPPLTAISGAALLLSLLAPAQARAITAAEAASGLAQGCYAIQSPGSGDTLSRHQGLLTSDLAFRFQKLAPAAAEHFFVKPASLREFMLTDRKGSYLSSLVPTVQSPAPAPSLASEWMITAKEVSPSNFLYQFKNRLTQQVISYPYLKTTWVKAWWGSYPVVTPAVDTQFRLVAQGDCRPYPEITSNVRGDRNLLKGNVSAPVRGYVDAHTHITSYEFMGGRVMHGSPFHRWGVPYALDDSRRTHGINGSLDLIGNIFVYGTPTHQYDTRGWPDFPWWPNPEQLTHSGYYYKWMERAWLSGLRITVAQVVENEVLCNAQSVINPVGWVGHNSCNEMDSIRLQVKRLREMQSYIDAQYGGPGKGFFRIVTSPAEARLVIADGKLAVVMGIEASETLNCGVHDFCSIASIEAGLNELYNLGIRGMFPAHKFDNQLSGAVLEDGFINVGEALSTGHYYEAEPCNAETRGKPMTSGIPLVGQVPPISTLTGQIGVTPTYSKSDDLCNWRGLTDKGVYLVNRMIDLNMIIEIDHMSDKAAKQVMDIVEARRYSGVVSSHSFMRPAKDGSLHRDFRRMLNAGGFAAHYGQGVDGARDGYQRYLDAVKQTPYLPAVGIGTDMSGLGGQPGPRGNAATDPLRYPFMSEFGLVFDRQVSGNRTFDLNRDGMAHYGMLADQIQDIRERSGPAVYEAVMKSAEGYLQMWERAAANRNLNHVNPL
ncbi:MAG: membrane dipeptidase [Fluviicoccus sp.]|uniref:membrane dipeptidase n=1 Tax=Fluviicoccus sp. TaxID=2003552 RepID=UPI0027288EB0|nr:membrane dipeptidase [Fluviicoccus sp.]MDO8332184.1 membrane dipeptidase [Fluviicoccus sp.]